MSKIEIENCILTFLIGFMIILDCVCIGPMSRFSTS